MTDSRGLMLGIPAAAWPAYTAEAYRVLKPNTGIAVFVEMNPQFKSDHYQITDSMPVKQVVPFF
jgi:hypothetical protein